MQCELEKASAEAYSIENREMHGSFSNLEYIGAESKIYADRAKTFIYYKDAEGRYWYKSILQEEADGKRGKQSSDSRKAG
nr:hypothetical protein [uncultured Lachnoclostridium sp.]